MKKESNFLNYLISYVPNFSSFEVLANSVINQFDSVQLKKNDFLVLENEVCPFFCYLESGILQHSIYVDGEEKTTYLALRNTVTTSLKSFLNQTPSRKSIKALSDCDLKVIRLEVFQDLLLKNTFFSHFYHNLIEKQIMLIDDYRIDLLTLTPEERYKKMLLSEPHLLQEVPLHYLASFLGISNRHMSRIRKNIK